MKILYVEDDPRDAFITQRTLEKSAPHLNIELAGTVGDAIARLKRFEHQPLDLVLTDMVLPDGSGLSLAAQIRELGLPVAIVVITGIGDEETVVAALKAGADDYVVKRKDYLDRLPLTLGSALDNSRAGRARRSRPIRVLYAEPDPVDADLARHHFARHAAHIQMDIVSLGVDALARLEKRNGHGGAYDLLLVDYRLPDLDGLELLKELKLIRKMAIPTVLVTAQGSQELALQALKVGASSYVVKHAGYLYQLVGEIENETSTAELARREEALRLSQERYTLATSAGSVGVWDWDRESGEIYVDSVLKSILGYRDDEVRNRVEDLARLIYPEDVEMVTQRARAYLSGENSGFEIECRMQHRDNGIRWILVRGNNVADKDGKSVRLVGTATDVTERKTAADALHESEERNRAMIRALPDMIFLMTRDGLFLDYHVKDLNQLYVSPNDFLGKHISKVMPPGIADEFERSVRQTCATNEPARYEYSLAVNGHEQFFEWRLVTCNDNKVLCVVRDITERKDAEDKLYRSEERFREMAQHVDAVFFLREGFDRESTGRITYVSPAYEKMWGRSCDSLYQDGQSWLEPVHPEDRKRVETASRRAHDGSFDEEFRILLPNDEIRWVHLRTFPITGENSKDGRLAGIVVDITARKRSEMLRDGENRILEMIAANAPLKETLTGIVRLIESQFDGLHCSVMLIDEDGVHFRTGAAPSLPVAYATAVDGVTISPRLGACGAAVCRRERVIVHDIVNDPLYDGLRELLAPFGFKSCWSTPILSSKSNVLGSFAIHSYQVHSPSPAEIELGDSATQLAGIAIESKRAQEALRDSEQRLRLALEAGRMGAWNWNVKTNIVRWSSGQFIIMGFEPFSVEPTFELWRKRVHPDDFDRVAEVADKAVRDRSGFRTEYRVVWDDSTIRWVESQGMTVCDDKLEVTALTGLIIDVTERRRAQEELLASKARFEGILDIAEDAIVSVTANQQITLFNQGAEKIFGYKAEELLGKPLDILLPTPLTEIDGLNANRFAEPAISSRRMGQRREIVGRRKDGSLFPADASISRLDVAGDPVFTVILRDVTERKQAEDALRNSEERYRSVVDSQTELICRYLPDTTLTFVNEAYCRFFGKTREQLIGTKFLELIPESAREIAKDHVSSLIVNPRVEADEHEVVLPDGSIGWQRWLDYAIHDAAGNLAEFQAIGSDITERKRAQREVLQRDQLLQAMFHSLSSHVIVLDRQGVITYASRSWIAFAAGEQGVMGNLGVGSNYLAALRTAPPDLLTHAPVEALERVLSGELQTLTLEYPSRLPGGRERWFLMCVDAMPPGHGGLVISYTDITERKHTEQTLEEALAEVRQLKDRLHEENIYLQEAMMVAHDFGEIIGRSEALKRTLRQAEQVAPLDTTVLLTGETGTGKELLAHAIHNLSSRKGHTLVKVNCATLPAQLVESELFGHERGAFTGAHSKRVGRFEIANGGTIFLDEIGELPLDLQVKLLRVLQEGEFERLGSSHTVRVDVRVIAATNRNLEEAVHQGTFRSDLYYRLSIFPITIPPLRERREDIPMLVTHFVRQLSLKLGKQIESIPQETMDALLNYPWPGNVRELRNVIERAAIITQGPKLRLLDSLESGAIEEIPRAAAVAALQVDPGRVQTLDENQRSLIIQTLDNTYWRVEGPSGAAALLGIHPNTLRSRMKKLGIVKPRFKHNSEGGAAAAHKSGE